MLPPPETTLPRWRYIWRLLTRTAGTVDEPYHRRQGQLLAAVLLFGQGVTCVALFFKILLPTTEYIPATLPQIAIGFTGFVCLYWLNRFGHYRFAAPLTLLHGAAMTYWVACAQTLLLIFLVIPIALAGLLFPIRRAFIFNVLLLCSLAFVPQLCPLASPKALIFVALFIAVVIAILSLITHYRNLIEIDRARQISESESRYRSLVELSPDAIMVTAESLIAYVNAAAVRLFGAKTPDELIGRPAIDLVFQDGREKTKANVAIPVETIPVAQRIVRLDGQIRQVEAIGAMITFRGKPARQSVIRDVTDRNALIEKILQSEERFSKAFHSSPAGLAISTLQDGRLMYINDAMLDILKTTREAVTGKTAGEIIPHESIPRAQIMALLEQNGRVNGIERTVWLSDGTVKHLLYSAEKITVDGLPCVLSLNYDITDRKIAEQRSLELALQRERTQLLEAFITNASHDLRTPITTILTTAYLFEKVTEQVDRQLVSLAQTFPDHLPTEITDALKAIRKGTHQLHDRAKGLHRSANRLQQIVEGMLEMMRLDQITDFQLFPRDLNAVLRRIAEKFAQRAAEKGCAFTFTPAPDLLTVRLDDVEFTRALTHLIENAIQFTPPDGRINLRAEKRESLAVIEVADTGIGIPPEDLPHVFERFYRVDKARSSHTGGAGLGLPVAQRIIAGHAGHIEIHSTPNVGTTVRVTLPVVSAGHPTEPQTDPTTMSHAHMGPS